MSIPNLTSSQFGWSAEGEVITDQFEDDRGLPFCKETAIRAKTMDIYRRQLQSERDYLIRKIKIGEPEFREKIREIDRKLRQYEEGDASWASTNSPRLLFEKLKSDAKKTDIPVVGNLRVQRVEFTDGTTYTINRSAALSDFVHSETSLSELKDYLALSNPQTVYTPQHIAYFKTYYNNRDISNPVYRWPLQQEMANNIYRAYGTKDINKLYTIVEERRENLRRHALQDLFMHFQSRPVSQNSVVYGRVALLDTTKTPKTDKQTGYHLDERNQLMDMKAIYDELDGAPLVFDLEKTEGPFFDMEGRIHMPRNCCATELKEARLQTFLLNVSVQGNTKNAPLQYHINQYALWKLQTLNMTDDLKLHMNELNQKLRLNSETDFATAHEAIYLLRQLGYCSVNCYGGKDRTGYALALETYCAINDKLRERATPTKKLQDTLAAIGRKLMGPSSVAVKIVDDNTGFKALKLSRFDLELLLSGEGLNWLLGAATRLKVYLDACRMLVQKQGEIQQSRVKKILYHPKDDQKAA